MGLFDSLKQAGKDYVNFADNGYTRNWISLGIEFKFKAKTKDGEVTDFLIAMNTLTDSEAENDHVHVYGYNTSKPGITYRNGPRKTAWARFNGLSSSEAMQIIRGAEIM